MTMTTQNGGLMTAEELVWVIDPETRSAYRYTRDGKVDRLNETGVLDAGDAVPGFRVAMAHAFKAIGIEVSE